MAEMNAQRFHRLQEQYSDPLLTTLTVMLVALLLLVGPLQAAGVVAAYHFGIAFGLVMVVAMFIVSGSGVALAAILVAVALIALATVLGSRQPSAIDIYLDATAWLIAGMTLGIVVTRAVFAPGKVTYHRIVGAVLLSPGKTSSRTCRSRPSARAEPSRAELKRANDQCHVASHRGLRRYGVMISEARERLRQPKGAKPPQATPEPRS